MPKVIDNNEPQYIEDFRRHQPDWANNHAPGGDPEPEVDWLPAFKRAVFYHLDTHPDATLRFQRTYQRPILLGRSRSVYKLSDTLHLFGIKLEGLYPSVELHFDQGSDGIHIHYPKTPPGPGTSYELPTPFTDYGGYCTLKNLVVRGTSAEGTRGIIIQRASFLEAVEVFHFGWHGFHVTADVKRATDSIDGAISNANGTTLLNCRAYGCGHSPGTDDKRVSDANPEGHRPFGSGLRLEGGDANICYTRSFNGQSCAQWAIDDVGFLGNHHELPHCVGCYHEIPQWEYDINHHPEADETEKRDFRTYELAVGERINFAYRIENESSRGLLTAPYVENAEPTPIIDVRSPSFVIGGIGGADTEYTKRVKSGEFTNAWKATHPGPFQTAYELRLAEGNGTFLTFATHADSFNHPYRLKYVHFENDDIDQAAASNPWAGFFRLDRGNLNSQTALALTGVHSHEKTTLRELTRQLDPGRLVVLPHYRAISFNHIRKVEYGVWNTLEDIENALPAQERTEGDAYTCLSPAAGGVYEAVVVEDPDNAGTKVWGVVSRVQV